MQGEWGTGGMGFRDTVGMGFRDPQPFSPTCTALSGHCGFGGFHHCHEMLW